MAPPARVLLTPENIDVARRAQAQFGLCDACLGRRFGKVETGLTNAQRARKLRDAGDIPATPSAACFLCEGLLGELDAFADVAVEALAPYEHRHFLIGTRFEAAIEAREAEVNAALGITDSAERINSEVNREIGKRVAARTEKPVEFKQPDITAVVDTRFLDAELTFGALYLFGRYRKLSREIPQTRWPCRRCQGNGCVRCDGTGKQYQISVEEIVAAPFLEATRATTESFHGAGREDIDARCLGEGRPFVLEINDPRVRAVALEGMPDRVRALSDGLVEIGALRWSTKEEVAIIKEHRGSKTYRAVVRFERAVDDADLARVVASLKGARVQQRTPQRVEHRRADLVRDRQVIDIAVESHEGADATLRIHGDAGLYIKELVSGDEGRTEPSLTGMLGVAGLVTELDIVAVEYEPPVSVAPG